MSPSRSRSRSRSPWPKKKRGTPFGGRVATSRGARRPADRARRDRRRASPPSRAAADAREARANATRTRIESCAVGARTLRSFFAESILFPPPPTAPSSAFDENTFHSPASSPHFFATSSASLFAALELAAARFLTSFRSSPSVVVARISAGRRVRPARAPPTRFCFHPHPTLMPSAMRERGPSRRSPSREGEVALAVGRTTPTRDTNVAIAVERRPRARTRCGASRTANECNGVDSFPFSHRSTRREREERMNKRSRDSSEWGRQRGLFTLRCS